MVAKDKLCSLLGVKGKIILPLGFLGLLVSLVAFWFVFHLAAIQVAQTTVQTAKSLTAQIREQLRLYRAGAKQ